MDFSLNWWGDISGPTASTNPGGSGQSIFGTAPAVASVDFTPWLFYSPDANPNQPGVQLLQGSGTVTGKVSGGVLTLTGDDANNIIKLAQAGSDITVTGTNTIIDGGGGPVGSFTFAGVKSIKTVMKGGNDIVTIDPLTPFSLTGSATFDLGDGSNILSLITAGPLSLGSLTVKAGDGDDTFAVAGGTVTGNASLNFGAGDTEVVLNGLQVSGGGGLKVNATDGDDTLRMTGAQIT